MSIRDSQLLKRYLDKGDEAAFSQLVAVYGGLVLGAARRVTGETEAAKEAAQNTFIMLARKAPSLRGRESLGGWLHHTAMLSARNIVRSRRREERKRAALEESIDSDAVDAGAVWDEMRPVLDDSLAALPEKDRSAVVLRFYRGYSVQEVASALEVTLAAAQKRLGRALQKLRSNLHRQGVTLSVPALSAGLGMWMSKSSCAAAMTTAWAATATTQAATVGSSLTMPTIITIMTNSKIITTIVIAALLIGGGAIAVNKLRNPNNEPAPPAGAGVPAKSPASKAPARRDAAIRMQELEAEFGSERMRQARRIVALLQAGYETELEMSMMGLDMMTAQWVKKNEQAWGLDAGQARELAQLVATEQDARVRDYKKAVHAMGDLRTAAFAEAILLADQVARGDLDREEFELAYERLSALDAGDLELRMMAPFQIESYLMKQEFTSAIGAIVPADRRDAFQKDVAARRDRIVEAQLALLKHRIPDLSDQQLEELGGFVRKVGAFLPKRSLIEGFLTEAQNEAWRAKEEERQRQMATAPTKFHTTGKDGKTVVLDAPRMRTATDGQVPVYPWQEPMTLDAAEAEARKISQGGLFSQSTGPMFDPAPSGGGPVKAWPDRNETPEARAD